jgi:hypothetical protein
MFARLSNLAYLVLRFLFFNLVFMLSFDALPLSFSLASISFDLSLLAVNIYSCLRLSLLSSLLEQVDTSGYQTSSSLLEAAAARSSE